MANTIQSFFTYTSPSEERFSQINCLAFNKSGTLLATGSYKIVKLFTISENIIKYDTQWQPSINNILSVAFNPSGTILAVGSEDNIRLYNFLYEKRSVTNLKIPHGEFSSVKSIAFDSTGEFLAFISENNSKNTIIFWRIKYDSSDISILPIVTFYDYGHNFTSLVFQPITNRTLLVVREPITLNYFELSSKDNINWEAKIISRTSIISSGHINFIDFHPTANPPLLATVSDYTLKLFDCRNPLNISEKASVQTSELGNIVRCISVAFHPSELFLVTGHWDNTAKLWSISSDYKNLICIANLSRGSERNSGVNVAFHPSTNPLFIATGGTFNDKTIQFFKVPIQLIQSAGYTNNKSRFFKLVSVNGKEVDGGRYELPGKTKSGKTQTMGPKDKASTAFSEICKKNNKKGECSYKFAIQETTRGSNKKVYHYEGKRVKLDKPIVLELKDKKTGKIKKVAKKYKNIIISID